MIPKLSVLKQKPCHYLSWFCGSGIWIWLGWVILLFRIVSTEVACSYSMGGWAGLEVGDSLNHMFGTLLRWVEGWTQLGLETRKLTCGLSSLVASG